MIIITIQMTKPIWDRHTGNLKEEDLKDMPLFINGIEIGKVLSAKEEDKRFVCKAEIEEEHISFFEKNNIIVSEDLL